MFKMNGGYFLEASNSLLLLNKSDATLERMGNIETISHLEAAKRSVFDYREDNNWAISDPLNKKITDDKALMLKEITAIVGTDLMTQAIIWSNDIASEYNKMKIDFLDKHLNNQKTLKKQLD